MKKLKYKIAAYRKFRENAAWVKEHHGRSVFSQLNEILRLRKNGIHFEDYYKYCLFDNKRFTTFDEKLTYRGRDFKNAFRHFVDPHIFGIAFHKHVLYRLLDSWGLPVPEIYALYSPTPIGFERHRAMKTTNELENFLASTDKFPIFGKPSNASHGFGARGVIKRLGKDKLLYVTEEEITIKNFVKEVHEIAMETGTYMLGEFLQASDEFKKISGSIIPSARIIVLIREGIPEFFRSTILIPSDKKHVSNFASGQNKSLSGKVDIETGIISKVINSLGPDMNYVPVHHKSGIRVEGYKIKDWNETKKMILKASEAMAPFKMQHWDVTFTNRGPVILELNFIGDIEPMQVKGPPGVFDEQFRSFYETHQVW
jgi:putative polysaccharide biosynthesis protein